MGAPTPVLPVSQTPLVAIPSIRTSQTPLVATPAARVFLSKLSEGAKTALYHRRPWLELVDRNAFSKPESLSEVTNRLRKNWNYFRINYLLLLSAVVAFSLFSHPVSLFILLVLLGAWIFLYFFRTEPLVLYNRSFSEREVLGIMTILTIVIIFLTDVGSLLISATMVGLAIVCLHGAFRAPEDLFLDEQEAAGGIMSFLGNVPIQAAIVSHV
eukprot:Gb_20840 [translate_table: standard]